MKFEGIFGGELSADGLDAHSRTQAHVETISHPHAPSDAIIVPDAHLLFTGDFKRSGVDLILSNDDRELVLHDYFKGEKRAPLASPDGAHLTGDLVNALTGHVEYSQADGSASAGKVIGHVTKLAGTATAVRNGVSIILNQGDNVEKGDVVQSGSGSTLGITFIDGTVFGLSSNARMVLNEMVYDPNGSNNSSLLSLVAGTISFVAGETAKHGDMKIDTPVATMGIRGTAVLVEIDFDVPGQGGTPDAKFQVLVEPDGHTGSYILFEKGTLTPLVTVDKAGQFVSIHNGDVSVGNALMSPDIQKLITDVFALKFTDNTNTNTKTAGLSTDTLTPQSFGLIRLPDGTLATPFFVNPIPPSNSPPPPTPTGTGTGNQHVDQPPAIHAFGNAATELAGVTGSSVLDTASSIINFVDINPGDAPSVKTAFDSFSYQNARHIDVTATLNAQQLADIAAVEVKLALVPDPGNNNNGSVAWTYSVADGAFDFLAAGETLTLTYQARVDNNYAPNDEASVTSFTITITGTNDVPVITTGPESVAYSGGKFTPGGNLPTVGNAPTTGTLSFTDVDLTDTHTVAVQLTDASMSGPGAATLDMAALDALAPAPMAAFEKALSAVVASDSTLTGSGTISWALADLPVYLADFVPTGEVLTLTYTVTLTDLQQATSTQTITVTITGTDAAAVVWIATTQTGSTGDWNDTANWETGTVPTATDDAIIITDQLQTLTPYYPVTINAAAAAKSLTMNDYGTLFTNSPKLINNSTLTVGAGGVSLSADSIVNNLGTISVAGQMEVLDQSSLQNYGQITLQDGGDFKDNSTITNFGSGTIEVAGGTLNVLVGVANSGQIAVDANATLALNGATITGGTVTNKSGGIVDLTGAAVLKNGSLGNSGQINVSGIGNELYGETVTANHALEVLSGGALLIDQGSTVANTQTTVDGTLTLNSATINNGTVTVDSSGGEIDLTGSGVLNGGHLGNSGKIKASSNGNALHNETVTANAMLEVMSGGGLTIDQTSTVANTATQVDSGGTLTLNAATVTGGTVTNKAGGTIDLTGTGVIQTGSLGNAGTIDVTGSGNALHGETVTANAMLEVMSGGALLIDQGSTVANTATQIDSGGTLTLNAATVTGGTVTNKAGGTIDLTGTGVIQTGSLGNAGTIDVTGSGNALHGETVTANAMLEVMSGGALTIDQISTVANTQTTVDGTLTLNSATINNGTVTVDSGGEIDLTGTGVLNGGDFGNSGKIKASGSGNALHNETVTANTELDVLASAALSIDQTSTVANTQTTVDGTLTLNSATINNGTVTVDSGGEIDLTGSGVLNGGDLGNAGTIDVTGSGNALHGETVTANNMLEVKSGGALSIDQISTVANTQTTVDGTLTLNSATINNGTVTIDSGGEIDLTGSGVLNGGDLGNAGQINVTGTGNALHNATVTANNMLEVKSGGALSIDQTSTVANTQTTVDGTLTLNSATINNGTVTVDSGGEIDLTGSGVLNGGDLGNAGTIDVTGSGNALHGETVTANNMLEVKSGGALSIDQISTVANTATQVDSGGTLTLNAATISGGTLGNSGMLNSTGTSAITNVGVTNSGLIELTGGTLTIDPSVAGPTLTNSGTLEANGGELDITSDPVGNTGTLQAIDNSTLKLTTLTVTNTGAGTVTVGSGSTLDLASATISGGTLGNSGTLNSTGTSAITNVGVTNSGLIESTGGTLTIDPVAGPTLTNSGTLEANGGELDITSDPVGNTGTLQAIDNSTLKLTTLTVTDTGAGTVTVGNGSTLDLVSATISGGTLGNSGTLNSTGTSALTNVGITNSGLIELTGGTLTIDPVAGPTLTNSGTLEANGGELDITSDPVGNTGTLQAIDNSTLKLTTLTVTDTGAGTVTVGSGSTLDLVSATISGGTLGNSGQTNVTGTGNALDNEKVTANNALEVMANSALLLDQGSAVTNGGGTITIDSTGTLTLNDATISGGTVADNGTIDVTGLSTINGNASLNQGSVTVESGVTLTLDNDTVTGTTFNNVNATTSIIQIDDGTTLTLSGATINGGTIKDGTAGGTGTPKTFGSIDVTGSSKISGASLNNGGVKVESSKVLTLDNVTATGTTFTDPGTIKVESNKTLTLAGTDTITGGQFAIGQGKVAQATGGGVLLSGVSIGNLNTGNPQVTLTITASSGSLAALSGSGLTVVGGLNGTNGTIEVTGTLSAVNAALASGLTYSPVGTSNTLTMTIDDGSGDTAFRTLTIATPLVGSPSFQVTDASGAIRIAGPNGQNSGLLDITGTTTLSSDEVFNGSANLKVEANATLKLIHTGTHGGTITDNGTIEITGESGINGGLLNIGANGVLLIDSGKLLTLNGSTVTGTVTDNGTIEVTGSSAINGAKLSNGGITVDSGQTLTLDGTTVNGTVFTDTATGAALSLDGGDTLTLQNGASVSCGTLSIGSLGVLDTAYGTAGTGATLDHVIVGNSGTVQVDAGTTLTLRDGASISGGTITDHGTIDATGDDTIDSSISLVGGLIKVEDNSTLTLGDALSIGANTVTLAGANAVLDDSAGLSLAGGTIGGLGNLAADTNLTGYGTVSIPLDSADQVTASGGTLEFTKAVDSTMATSFDIAAAANSVLKFDAAVGTASVNPTITFAGDDDGAGVLDLTAISLSNFHGVIANFDEGEAIDVHNAASASLDSTGKILTVFDSSGNSLGAIDLATSYAGDTFNVSNSGAITVDDLAVTLDHTTATEGTAINVTAVADGGVSLTSGVTYSWQTLDGNGHWDQVGSNASYTPTETDEGQSLRLVTTYAADPSGGESTTVNLGIVAEDPNENAPIALAGLDVNNNAVEGQQITASVTEADAGSGAVFIYTWTVAGQPVGDTNNTYTPTEADEGKAISVAVSFTDTHGFAETGTTTAGIVQESGSENAPIALAGLDVNNNAVEGQQLTASVTEADAGSGAVFTYTWTVAGQPVGDTGNTYTPTEADEGKAISVAVAFTDTRGFTETGSTTAGIVQESGSENAPIALAGLDVNNNAVEGQQITASVTEADAGSGAVFTYTWTVAGQPVGDTGNTYTPTEADEGKAISVAVSFTDTHGFTETGSTSAGIVQESGSENAPIALAGLDVNNNAVEGQQITASVTEADAGSGAVFTYTWTVGGQTVAGDTGNTYTPTEADEGKAISVAVAFTDTHGFAETGTTTAGIVQESGSENAPIALAGLDVNNNAVEGQQITASVTEADAGSGAVFTYTWTVAGQPVGDTSNTYTPTEADEGKAISVAVSFTDTHGFTETGTTTAGIVQESGSENAPIALAGLNVNNNAVEGQQITASVTEADAGSGAVFTYTWTVAGQPVGDTGNTYTPTEADEGKAISVAVAFTDTHGFAETGTTTAGIVQESAAAPVISTDNVALVAQTLFGSTGDENATGITYANGELYVVGDNPEGGSSPSAQSYVDLFSVNGTTPVWSQAWHYGNFNGIAVDSHEVYAVGVISAGDTSILPPDSDNEDKTLLVSFSANDGTELGFTSHTWNGTSGTTNFFGYKGVESFSNVIATTQAGNTILYAVGTGQPESYDGYIIAEYNSSGTLVTSVTDSLASFSNPGSSSANDVVDWNGALWVVGYNDHPNQGDTYGHATVWTTSYDLSSVVMHEDNTGVAASFNSVATIGNELYAVGYANVSSGQQDYLIAEYNADGSVAWNATFGPAGTDTLTGALAVDGHLYVVGSTTNGSSTEGVLMEIDASNGNVISTQTYDAAQYNTFTSITTDGHYLYVAGASGSSAGNDQAVLLTYDVGGTTMTTVEDTAVTMHSLAVSDVAAGSAQIEVTLAVGHGSIALENSSGLESVVGADTGSVELFGSQAAINAVLAHGVVYDPTANYIGSDTLTITADDQGNNASHVAQSTTQDVGITVTAADSIDNGATYTVSAPSGDTIAFATGNGTLDLTQPSTFTGEIAGITGTGNVLDLHGFAAATTMASTGSGSFHSITDTTTLTVTDSSDNQTETFTLAGNLSASTWNVSDDATHNGVDIVDPPATSQSVGPPVAYGPGPATSNTIVASVPNQTLTGGSGSNAFVFNFAGIGQDTVANFHPATDTLRFGGAIFETAQAVLNAIQDDGHGNTVVTLDAHDAITLSGVVKAQLHASDFHFV